MAEAKAGTLGEGGMASSAPFLLSQEQEVAVRRLWWISQMFNAAVGDAMANLIGVEALLMLAQAERREGGESKQQLPASLEEWHQLYTDLPSRQLKVSAADEGKLLQAVGDEVNVWVMHSREGKVRSQPCSRAPCRVQRAMWPVYGTQ